MIEVRVLRQTDVGTSSLMFLFVPALRNVYFLGIGAFSLAVEFSLTGVTTRASMFLPVIIIYVYTGCNAEGSECSYEITSLKPNSPYAILVVSGNSATNDSECVSNITVLGSRYLVMIVGTEDAIDGK